jgi:hypothetical protein
MSRSRERGERFVIYASRAALEQAQRLGLDGVLENRVADGIRAYRQHRRSLPGMRPLAENERLVELDGGLVARTVTRDRTASGKRRVLVYRVDQINHNRNGGDAR